MKIHETLVTQSLNYCVLIHLIRILAVLVQKFLYVCIL